MKSLATLTALAAALWLGPASSNLAAQPDLAGALTRIATSRIFFLHHSVGENILSGLRRINSQSGTAGAVRIVNASGAVPPYGAALMAFTGGENEQPKTKIDAFAREIRNRSDLKPDMAFMKLCYVDFGPQTDVDALFEYYRSTLDTLKRDFPGIRFAHVTVPLKRRASPARRIYLQATGAPDLNDAANAKRGQFSDRLRSAFSQDPIFDLARIEATAPDGKVSGFSYEGRVYLAMYEGYTEDGGHLNEAGQTATAAALVKFLSEHEPAARADGQ